MEAMSVLSEMGSINSREKELPSLLWFMLRQSSPHTGIPETEWRRSTNGESVSV